MAKDTGIYQDFIPAGDDPGPIGAGGYQDFVPPFEPKVVPEPTSEIEEVKPVKAK